MQPTILVGDRVYVNKLAYDLKVPFTTWHLAAWDNPKRGDVVVFFAPSDGTRMVKRIIGVPGDVIELRNEQLVINGNAVEYGTLNTGVSGQLNPAEQKMSQFATERLPGHTHAVMAIPSVQAKRTFGPVVVPQGKYFMMGDNRDNSLDSRYWGLVERKEIVGKATGVVASLDKERWWMPRWNRFFRKMDGATGGDAGAM
jgi:signal peptidase I